MIYERPIGMATPTVNELEDEIAEMEAENQRLRDALKRIVQQTEHPSSVMYAVATKRLYGIAQAAIKVVDGE